MFEEKVKTWLEKNGFDNLDVIDDNAFVYDIEEQTIYLGVVSTSEGQWFEQFMYEYGLEYTGILPEVLAFIHELGHHCTINRFNENDFLHDSQSKAFVDFMAYSYKRMSYYWELPIEFAANMWAVDFINNNIAAVEELCNMWEVC